MPQRPALVILSRILSNGDDLSLGCDKEQLAILREGLVASTSISLNDLRRSMPGIPHPTPLAPPQQMLKVLVFTALDPSHVTITTRSPLEVHLDLIQEAATLRPNPAGGGALTQRDMRVFEAERVHARPSLFGRRGSLIFSFSPIHCIITPSRLILIQRAGEPPSPATLLTLRRLEALCTVDSLPSTTPSPSSFPAAALEVCLRVLVVVLGERIKALEARVDHCAREMTSGSTVSGAFAAEAMGVKRGLVEVEGEVAAFALEVGAGGDALLSPCSPLSTSLLAAADWDGMAPLPPRSALEGISVAHAMVRRSTVLLQEMQAQCATLTSRLLSHERSLNLHLDANRNKLTFFQVGVLLSTLVIALASLISAYLGMNVPSPLATSSTAFFLVSMLTSLGALVLVFLLVGWVNRRFQIVGVPVAPLWALTLLHRVGWLGAAELPSPYPTTATHNLTFRKRVNVDEDIVAYLAEAPVFVPLQELLGKCTTDSDTFISSSSSSSSSFTGIGDGASEILEVVATTLGDIGGEVVVLHSRSPKDMLLAMLASLGGGGINGRPLSLGDLHNLDPRTPTPSCVWTRKGALCIRLDPIFACILSTGTVYLWAGKQGEFVGQEALLGAAALAAAATATAAAAAAAAAETSGDEGGGKGSRRRSCSSSSSSSPALQALRVLVEGVHGRALEEECGRLARAADALSTQVKGHTQGLRRHQQPSIDLQSLREGVNRAMSKVSGALNALLPLLDDDDDDDDATPPQQNPLGGGVELQVQVGGGGVVEEGGVVEVEVDVEVEVEMTAAGEVAREVVVRAIERLHGLKDELGAIAGSLDTTGRNIQLAIDSQQNLVLRWEVLATITDVSFNIMAGIMSFPGQSINNGSYSPDVGVGGSVAAFQSVVTGSVVSGIVAFLLLYSVLSRL